MTSETTEYSWKAVTGAVTNLVASTAQHSARVRTAPEMFLKNAKKAKILTSVQICE